MAYSPKKTTVPRFSEANGFYTTPERSALMAKISSKNTKAELKLRKTLWALGCRYRINARELPGTPDIIFPKLQLAIFVDGGFWHGQNWETKKGAIKKNRDFWVPKIERNMERDEEANRALEKMGWKVFRFWEEDIQKNLLGCVRKVLDYVEFGIEKDPTLD